MNIFPYYSQQRRPKLERRKKIFLKHPTQVCWLENETKSCNCWVWQLRGTMKVKEVCTLLYFVGQRKSRVAQLFQKKCKQRWDHESERVS